MIKAFCVCVFLWGMLVTFLPWLVTGDRSFSVDVIVTSLGLALCLSAVAMWRCKPR
jgi:hypothetical protein